MPRPLVAFILMATTIPVLHATPLTSAPASPTPVPATLPPADALAERRVVQPGEDGLYADYLRLHEQLGETLRKAALGQTMLETLEAQSPTAPSPGGTAMQRTGDVQLPRDLRAMFWTTTGNRPEATDPAYLGTLSPSPLLIGVNGRVALRIYGLSESPNLVGGHRENGSRDGAVGVTIGGGGATMFPNRAHSDYVTIGGGMNNQAGIAYRYLDSSYATVGGGRDNTAARPYATIGGGRGNSAEGHATVIAGGEHNFSNTAHAFIGGGRGNQANDLYAVISGGFTNRVDGKAGVVGGGENNRAGGGHATVAGGLHNHAGGLTASIPGGTLNQALGKSSFAAGARAIARHDGSFVWNDNIDSAFTSTAPQQFLVRATGNMGVGTDSPQEKLTVRGNVAPSEAKRFSLGSSQLPWNALHLSGDLHAAEGFSVRGPTTVLLSLDAEGNLTIPGTLQAGRIINKHGDALAATGAPPAPFVLPDELEPTRITGTALTLETRFGGVLEGTASHLRLRDGSVTSNQLAGVSVHRRHLAPASVGPEQLDLGALDARFLSLDGGALRKALELPRDGLVVGENQIITRRGRVGIGTVQPEEALTVAGVVHSSAGGFRFPDGSIQTSAAQPPGPVFDPAKISSFSVHGRIESSREGFRFPDGTVQTTAAIPPPLAAISNQLARITSLEAAINAVPAAASTALRSELETLASQLRGELADLEAIAARERGRLVPREEFLELQKELRAQGLESQNKLDERERLLRESIAGVRDERVATQLALQNRIETLSETLIRNVDALTARIDGHAERHRAYAAWERRLESSEAGLNQLNQQVSGLATGVNSVQGTILELQKKVADAAGTSATLPPQLVQEWTGLGTKVDTLKRQVDEQVARVDQLQRTWETRPSSPAAGSQVGPDLQERWRQTDEQVSSLAKNLETQSGHLGTLLQDLESLRTQHQDLSDRFLQVPGALAAFKQGLQSMQTTLGQTPEQIEELRRTLATLTGNDFQELRRSLDAVRKDADALIAERIRAALLPMTETVETLSRELNSAKGPLAKIDAMEARLEQQAHVSRQHTEQQRETASAIQKSTQELSRLDARIAGLNIPDLTPHTAAMQQEFRRVDTALERLSERIARLSATPPQTTPATDLEPELQRLSRALSALDERVSRLASPPAQLPASQPTPTPVPKGPEFQKEFARVDAMLVGLDERLSQLSQQVTRAPALPDMNSILRRLGTTEKQLAALEAQVAQAGRAEQEQTRAALTSLATSLATQQEALATQTEAQRMRLQSLEAALQQLAARDTSYNDQEIRSTLESLSGQLDSVRRSTQSIGETRETLTRTQESLTGIEARLGGVTDAMKALERSVAASPDAARVDQVDRRLVELQQTQRDLEARYLELQNSVVGSLGEQQKRNDEDRRRQDSVLRALEATVTNLQKEIAALPPPPKDLAPEVQNLRNELGGLATRVDALPPPEPVAPVVDKAVASLTRQIEALRGELQRQSTAVPPPPTPHPLDQRVRVQNGSLEFVGDGGTLLSLDPQGNLLLRGRLRAQGFEGDGSALRGLGPQEAMPPPAPGMTDARVMTLITQTALLPESVADGDVHGTLASLKLKRNSVGRAALLPNAVDGARIQDGTVSLLDLDVQSVDRRYLTVNGGTLTGTLRLPEDGLQVGGGQLSLIGGRVGLGTSSPQADLDVTGTLRIGGGNPGEGKVLRSDASGVAYWDAPANLNQNHGWSLTGNRNSRPGAEFLGTVDERPLELRVNNQTALRIQPAAETPSFLGGHSANLADRREGAVISGGGSAGAPNRANGDFAVVGGGLGNEAGFLAMVAGGMGNQALGQSSVISGGYSNQTAEAFSTVSGGADNRANGNGASVGGGAGNRATGNFATVPGGSGNLAAGAHSTAMGRSAVATHPGTFVWADGTDSGARSDQSHQFKVRASGGVRMLSGPGESTGVALEPGGHAWSYRRHAGQMYETQDIETASVLSGLKQVPVRAFQTGRGADAPRHALVDGEAFHRSFGLGEPAAGLNSADVDAVTLAAVQALLSRVEEQDARILEQEKKIILLQAELNRLLRLSHER